MRFPQLDLPRPESVSVKGADGEERPDPVEDGAELALERSGPERFLSSCALLEQLVALVSRTSSDIDDDQTAFSDSLYFSMVSLIVAPAVT